MADRDREPTDDMPGAPKPGEDIVDESDDMDEEFEDADELDEDADAADDVDDE